MMSAHHPLGDKDLKNGHTGHQRRYAWSDSLVRQKHQEAGHTITVPAMKGAPFK